MNIFQYLSLDENHRSQTKVTQLVKHYDEVPSKHKDKTFCVQKKEDGVCALAVVDAYTCKIFSRTGKEFQNVSKLNFEMSESRLPIGVYLGEIVNDDFSLEQLSGVVNPNRTKDLDENGKKLLENMKFKMFDFLEIDEFINGKSDTAWEDRFHKLCCNVYKANPQEFNYSFEVIPSVPELYDNLIDLSLEAAVAKGHEGIVIRDPKAGWLAGHKGWHVMKKVRGVDYDLRCIGYEEGTGKYKGKVANLVFQWKNGETIKCMLGKGWTHESAEQMFRDIVVGSEDESSHPIGKIFQVYALDESSKGKLRLAKVGERRFDKDYADV